jgi:hypothetical protein
MASVFRNMGLQDQAIKLMIQKNYDHGVHPLRFKEFLWYGVFGRLIGFGYEPWNAFFASMFFIGLGWMLFDAGYRRDLVTPTDKDAYDKKDSGKPDLSEFYPRFSPLVYSLETFVPLLKLWMSDYWAPNATRLSRLKILSVQLPFTGRGLRFYLWFHVAAGWVLTTLWVGGLTGLIKG